MVFLNNKALNDDATIFYPERELGMRFVMHWILYLVVFCIVDNQPDKTLAANQPYEPSFILLFVSERKQTAAESKIPMMTNGSETGRYYE